MADTTLFERVGGEAAVEAAVKAFYKRVLADDSINHYFAHMDMTAQHEKQRKFLTMVMGGPNEYSGLDMHAAHKGLGLKESDFDAIVKHLTGALDELSVPAKEKGEILGAVGGLHDAVMGTGEYAGK